MKRFTLLFLMSLLSFCGYAQLAPECFEDPWTPVPAATGTSAQWLTLDNGVGTAFTWVQEPHSATLPSYEGTAGTHSAYIDKENVAVGTFAEDFLVTPEFTMPVGGVLTFQSKLTTAGVQGSIYRVYVLPSGADETDPAAYVEIQEWTESQLAISPILVWEEKTLTFGTTYDGQTVRLAFSMTGDNFDRWQIDCVSVTEPCGEVENLTAENIGLDTAELSWDNPGGATSFEVEIILEGDVPTGNGIIVTSNSYVATSTASGDPLVQVPFISNTGYKYYVRAICDDGGTSDIVGAYFFQTVGLGDTCTAPLEISTLPFSDTDNTANYADEYNGMPGNSCGGSPWDEYLSGNDVVYSFTADFTGTVSVDLTNNDSYSGIFIYDECDDIGDECIGGGVGNWEGTDVIIPGFNVVDGEDYYFVISTAYNQTTNYTLTIQQEFCDKPVGLPASNLGMTTASLSWTNPSGATSWQVQVQPADTGIPAGAGEYTANTNTNWPVPTADLTASTAYEYYVRADCGDGSFSAWAGPYYFNTAICEVANQCTYTFNMWGQWDSTWNGHTMNVVQNGIVVSTLTGPSTWGMGTVTQDVQLCNGFPFELYWNNNNNWAGDVAVSITNNFGQEIYIKNPGAGSPGTSLFSLEELDCDNPLCLAPTGLAVDNMGMTTVDLSWDGQPTGNWEYYITEAGNPAPTAADDGVLTSTNPTIGATLLEGGPATLTMATNYEYYVRMICEDASTDESEWSEPFAFATASCEVADQCEYTFVMNSNWWAGWQGGSMTISQNGATVAVIGSTFTTGQTQSVTVPLCDDVPFEVEWTSGGGWMGQMGLQIINSYDQTLFTLPFNQTTGVGTVIFEAENDCDFPACVAPTGLYTQNGTMTSIELGWDGPATGAWEYYIVEAGGPAPDGSTPGISATTNPTTATLADSGTNYEFYVRLVCEGAASDYSAWAGPHAFHSEICAEEDKCNFTFEMLSQNNWGGGSNTFTIYQGGVPVATFPSAGNENWWGNDGYSEEIALCHNVEIEVVWNVGGWDANDKGLVIYSPFLEDIYTMDFGSQSQGDTVFTGLVSCDPPPCPKPQNLSVTDIQLTQVTLNWEEMGAATEWAVWVVPMGAEDPLPDSVPTFTTTSNPVVYGDDASEVLVAGTPYQFYVMAMCGEEDGNSTVAGQEVFVTAIANDDCEGAVDVPVNAGIVCDEFVSGTLTGATSAGIQPSCMWGMPVADVWYSFVATSENQAISVLNTTGGIFPYIAVFEGDCDGGLTELFCGYNNPVSLNELTVGNTYYVMVYVDWFNDPTAVTSFDLCIRTPEPPISVSDTLYTVEELVQEVLLGSECAVISNVTSSTGTDYSSSSGIGYFNQNGSSFPFEDGMILATGDIQEAPAGSTFFGNDNYTWVGDNDLLDILNEGGFFGQTHNASIVEFDFVPLADNISFNFLFASNEWGTFQCNFSDAFAFILTGASIDDNLAVIPGTEIPVSVTSIRDDAYNAGCGDANVEYFGQYNANDPIAANISYNGQTVVMQASAPVVPGETYHIKLVIADWNDTAVNSAVFIEGGSFDVGEVDLGLDMTQENDNAICNDGQAVLDTELDEETYDFIWYANDVVIDGETDPTLVINQDDFDFESGPITFKVEAYFAGSNCAKVGDIIVEFYNDVEVDAGDASDLFICDDSGFASFNLEENTDLVLSGDGITDPSDYTVTYHASQEDAESGDNDLASPFTNTVAGGQTIYVRILHVAGCLGYKQFQITVGQSEAVIDLTDDFTLCGGASGTVTATVTNVTGDVTYTWTKDGEPFAGTTNSIEVTEAGIYEVTIAENGCTKSASMTVEVNEVPVVEPVGDVFECEAYELPALAVGNYFTGENGTGTQLAAGSLIETNQTVYVYAANGECTDQTSFTVTISSPVVAEVTDDCVEGVYMLEVTDVDGSFDPATASYAWTGPNGFVSSSQAFSAVESGPGVYNVTVTTADGCVGTASFEVMATQCLIQRGISPNGDGENDSFDLSNLDVHQLSIFNRYGQEVYSRTNYSNEWFGQSDSGDELPTGTYFYMIERSNGEQITGWIYINREE